MVWHLKIESGVQKLEIFKVLRKKWKYFLIWGRNGQQKKGKIMAIFIFCLFHFVLVFQPYLPLLLKKYIVFFLNVDLLLKSDSKNILWCMRVFFLFSHFTFLGNFDFWGQQMRSSQLDECKSADNIKLADQVIRSYQLIRIRSLLEIRAFLEVKSASGLRSKWLAWFGNLVL